jgi:NaMN:DMB phosphoribosyltransferase
MSEARPEAFTAMALIAELMIELETKFGPTFTDAIIARTKQRIDDSLAEDDGDDGDAMQMVRGLGDFEGMIRPPTVRPPE